MGTFLSLLGIVAAFFMMKYREKIGDMLGEAEWMQKIGGVYTFIILLALFIFIWSIAALTGTTGVLFAPLRWILPFGTRSPAVEGY